MMVLTHGVCLFIYLYTGNGIWNITEIIRGLGCLFPRGGFVCFFQVPEGTSRPGSLYSKLRVWCFCTNQVIWSQVHGKADLLPVHSYFWNAAIWGPNSTALVGGRLPGVSCVGPWKGQTHTGPLDHLWQISLPPGLTSLDCPSFQSINLVILHYAGSFLLLLKRCMYISSPPFFQGGGQII